jgi:Ca2+-binding RTX toxin-like protein
VGESGGNDVIYGGAGNDRIGGKGGDDRLFGDAGDDRIWGDDGDDLLRGGLGNDILTGDDFSGGSGSDTFVLARGEGTDTIVDFQVGVDFIALVGDLSFGDLTLNGNEIKVGDDTLAIVRGVDTLSASDFISL